MGFDFDNVKDEEENSAILVMQGLLLEGLLRNKRTWEWSRILMGINAQHSENFSYHYAEQQFSRKLP